MGGHVTLAAIPLDHPTAEPVRLSVELKEIAGAPRRIGLRFLPSGRYRIIAMAGGIEAKLGEQPLMEPQVVELSEGQIVDGLKWKLNDF